MYAPCRAAPHEAALAPGPGSPVKLFMQSGGQVADALADPPRQVAVTGARRQGKTHVLRLARLRAVAKGATINGTYRMSPEPALEAFRADLLALVGE